MSSKQQSRSSKQPSSFGRVAVLFGGTSAEREVSLESGQAVCAALTRKGIDVIAIDVQKNPVAQLSQVAFDCAFIALHGPGGEDGSMQGLLKHMGKPFTGSDLSASALAMDKLRSKYVFSALGISTPQFCLLNGDSDWSQVLEQLGGEVMVKPAGEGSSIGMAKAKTAEALEQAYLAASQYDSCVFAERLIVGAEYTVGILAGKSLPAIKLETDNDFYDYNAKYIQNDTRYLCPCGLSEKDEQRLAELAQASFAALGCSGWGRVDFMADADGNFYVLEVNTVPGMTSHSLVPMAAKASGLGFDDLCMTILEQVSVCN